MHTYTDGCEYELFFPNQEIIFNRRLYKVLLQGFIHFIINVIAFPYRVVEQF